MRIFGLTGGVGMGKSAAAEILHARGIPVVDTDVLARKVVEPGGPALEEIKSEFGCDIVLPDGTLHREKLASIVFCNLDKRQALERITHPRIQELWREQISAWRGMEKYSSGVVMIPLLFETAAEKEFDAIVCVACTFLTQCERLLLRGWAEAMVRQRIAAQWPVEKKMANADFVVWSEGDLSVLSAQLDQIFR